MVSTPEIVLSGFAFPESLRWHNQQLWFSDVLTGEVHRSSLDGNTEIVTHVSPTVSGLGWLPTGELLVVDCDARQIVRISETGEKHLHADLSSHWRFPANDMLVDEDGTAWVGSYGFNPEADAPVPSSMLKVSRTGEVIGEVPDLVFPNGAGRIDTNHFIVSETFAGRLAIVNTEGTPKVIRRIELPDGSTPDGLAVKEDGSVWVALAYSECVVRIDLETGKSERAIELPGIGVYDCTFIDSNTLLIATSDKDESHVVEDRPGKILKVTVG